MKKTLLMSASLLAALALAPAAAHAQSYGYAGKDADQRILGQTQYTAPPVQVSQQEVETVRTIEPAAGPATGVRNFTGPYAGVSGGYNIGSYEFTNPAGPISGDVGVDGFEGGVFIGFGMAQERMRMLGGYLGIEGGYEWSDANGSVDGVGYKKRGEWLATLRPGAVFGNTLGYGIIGYSRAQFDAGPARARKNGLVLGAGGEFGAIGPFGIRAEYTYTNYGDRNIGPINVDGHESEVKLGALMRF